LWICLYTIVSCYLYIHHDNLADFLDRTDIEQEVNGLYSFDRRPKLDVEAVRRINEAACKLYYEQIEKGAKY
jgi:hypothetical protein